MTATFEEMEQRRKNRLQVLAAVFPGDPKLQNALAMGEGVCEQLPPLAEALKKEIRGCYTADLTKPGAETTAQEEKLMQSVADVLAWATQLELALHDLRQALFFRFNKRLLGKPPAPSDEERQREANREAAKKAKLETATRPAEITPQAPAVEERAAESLQGLFDNLG